MTERYNGFSGLNVFITVGGRLFKPEELDLLKLDVTDADEGDSDVELQCSDDDFKIADAGLFRVGQIMSVKFGYVNGEMSADRTGYVIMKPATSYAKDGVLSTIKASTKSATLAARRPQKNYGPTSLRNILSEVARRNGLKLEIEGGNEQLKGFSQGNWSDRQTCRVLADRFGYQCTFSSETIVFAPRNYNATPTLELVFGNGEEANILSADLNVDAKKEDNTTQAINVNPSSKSTKTVTAGEASKALAISAENGHSWETKVSHEQVVLPPTTSQNQGVSTMGFPLGNSVQSALDSTDLKTLLSTPDTVEGNMLAHATAEKLTKQKKKGELTVTCVGIPAARARILVHVKGLAKRDSGNWYVSSVTHSIGKSDGYTTSFELNRHGANTQGGDKTKSPLNSQLPQKNGDGTKQVVAVSAESGSTWRTK